jgi:ribose 5-phosphate isomerase B
MKIAIASDHAGYRYKEAIKDHLAKLGHEIADFGAFSEESSDYPDFIRPAAQAVADGASEKGVVLGGSGNGEAITANKVRGIRCAVVWNTESAVLAKEHNDANIISIGERMMTVDAAIAAVDAWLGATFAGGRHLRRIQKIEIG